MSQCNNISATLGHDIKHSRSEALQSEVEAFLASGGKINGGSTPIEYDFNNRKKPVTSHNSEYFEASKQRQKIQVPIIQDYSKWGGSKKWQKLADASGNLVSPVHLANVNKGKTTIADLDVWKKIVEAIEELKGGV